MTPTDVPEVGPPDAGAPLPGGPEASSATVAESDAEQSEDSPPPRRKPFGPVAVSLSGLVVLLLVAGGILGWQLIGTDVRAHRQAREAITRTTHDWAKVPAPGRATTGQVMGVITIASIGLTYPVVAGVDEKSLQQGVGWYPSTASPGAQGNAALAGLRVTYGSPFRRLLELKPGDLIVVDTAEATSTYRVVIAPSDLTVDASAAWVLDPIPGQANLPPQQGILTLTTAQDLVATSERSVAFATLVSRVER